MLVKNLGFYQPWSWRITSKLLPPPLFYCVVFADERRGHSCSSVYSVAIQRSYFCRPRPGPVVTRSPRAVLIISYSFNPLVDWFLTSHCTFSTNSLYRVMGV